MEAQTIINVCLFSVFAVGLIVGASKGLIRQVIELIGLVGSFFIAVLFAGWLAAVLQTQVSMPYSPSLVVAFVAIFIAGLIGFHFVALGLQKVVRMTFFGWVDRVCGAALGLIAAMLVASLLVTVALELPISKDARESVERSEVSMFVRPMAPWLFNFVFSRGDTGIAYDRIFKRGGVI